MTLDPAEIERLREISHIRLDADGRFWHEGALVEHPRVVAAFHRGLGRSPDGRPTVSFGRTWCYIEAEGALYQVRAAVCRVDSAGSVIDCLARLDDETEERVTVVPPSVGVDTEGVLYLRVKEGREWARLLPSAQVELGRFAELGDAGEPVLRTATGLCPLSVITDGGRAR